VVGCAVCTTTSLVYSAVRSIRDFQRCQEFHCLGNWTHDAASGCLMPPPPTSPSPLPPHGGVVLCYEPKTSKLLYVDTFDSFPSPSSCFFSVAFHTEERHRVRDPSSVRAVHSLIDCCASSRRIIQQNKHKCVPLGETANCNKPTYEAQLL